MVQNFIAMLGLQEHVCSGVLVPGRLVQVVMHVWQQNLCGVAHQ